MVTEPSCATNKFVKEANADDQRLYAALLIKSFEGFFGYLMQSPQAQELKAPTANSMI